MSAGACPIVGLSFKSYIRPRGRVVYGSFYSRTYRRFFRLLVCLPVFQAPGGQ